jgi:hypothetical protein
MNRRATAGRPYRLTTGFSGGTCRGGLRPPGANAQNAIFEQAGDRRSPLQAYNGVLGGTCRGGLARPGQMPKTHINCPFWFANDIPANEPAGDRRSPLQAYNGVSGGTCRGGLRPPARGKCPKRILIARLGLLTIFPRKDRRATAGRPYRLTTGFWVVLRCLARPGQMPKTHINCPFGFANDIPANEQAGDRRSPLQAYNGVSGGTCRGGLRPPGANAQNAY